MVLVLGCRGLVVCLHNMLFRVPLDWRSTVRLKSRLRCTSKSYQVDLFAQRAPLISSFIRRILLATIAEELRSIDGGRK